MHCRRFRPLAWTRREMLRRSACGFGSVALSALLCERAFGGAERPTIQASHFRRTARNVIFLYMDGGVSQVDSFDPKPRLDREHGQPYSAKMEPTQFANVGTILRSPWKFERHGECGHAISALFPYVARAADRLCVVRSMTSEFSEHNTANYFLHTGTGMQGRPSMGAWIGYGLGSESVDLPGFVVINGGLIPSGGADCFGASFLPAELEATLLKPQPNPVANIQPLEAESDAQPAKLDLIRRLDAAAFDRLGRDEAVEGAIANYEMAHRMQISIPAVADLSQETSATHRLYGTDAEYEPTQIYARQCLLARRLVERGVRFIELTCPQIQGNDRWDAHSDLASNHSTNARAVDQPIAGLLTDLEQRGLLDETLVVFTGEFGRTPFAQGSDGRDHNPYGFSLWMAGGGVRGGAAYGATDEYGYRVVENRMEMYDLHATMLHLLGLDHTQLTYRFGGRDMRLTDVHGRVVHDLLA